MLEKKLIQNNNKKTLSGFTFIEVMVVIIIIALLTGFTGVYILESLGKAKV